MARSPQYLDACSLVLVNLNDPAEASELAYQRKICGWSYDSKYIKKWRGDMDQAQKTLFWITVPSRDGIDFRAGHISLDSLARSAYPEFQNSNKSIMAINTFFILPEYRSLGLGRKSMDLIEDLATKGPHGSPDCKAVLVDTFSQKNFEGEERQALLWKCYPEAMERGTTCSEPWYQRRGYVNVKEAPGYPVKTSDGEENSFIQVFLKKDLKRA